MSVTVQSMPIAMSATTTLAIIGGVLTVIAALALLRKGAFRLAEGMTTFNKAMVPNAKYMPHLAELAPMSSVLQEIAAQFRTNSGSSLRDVVERLEGHARDNKAAAAEAQAAAAEAKQAVVEATAALTEFARTNAAGIKALEVMMGTAREHAADERSLARADRDLARDALQQMRELAASAERTEASGERVEASGLRTEASGARTEAADAVVASDLAASEKRADDVASHEAPGAAADAASQSANDEP